MMRRAAVLLLAVAGVVFGQGWYTDGGTWAKRKKITIDSKRVAGSGVVAEFPVLFATTDPDLKALSRGGFVGSGQSFAFTAADGTTRLPHEIERYDAETGTLVAWVTAPAVSPVADNPYQDLWNLIGHVLVEMVPDFFRRNAR